MQKIASLLLFITASVTLFSQTWSDNVAEIVYNKCSQCHHQGGIGQFSLVSYSEVSNMAAAVHDAVNADQMPPWPPDNNYRQYVHNRALSTDEKTTFISWLTNGTPEGNSANTPPPPVFNTGSILGQGDLEVSIPAYMSKASSLADDYVCFSIPSGLVSDRVIKAVEIIPGNREIVHHALIYLDQAAVEQTDTIGGDCSSPSATTTKLIAGYTPGATPMVLPSSSPLKLGMPISAGANIYFAMHYPAGSYGLYDSTKVIFHFYPEGATGIREVFADPIIQNWNFTLPPNQITTVSAQYPAGVNGINNQVSLLSVFPHMHLLGKDIKSFGVTATNDTIPLINVPHWDFHWQDFYFFKNMPHIPVGTHIKATGHFDNTTANEHNPNNPPITVYPGLNTNDEMFLVYFHYIGYQNGDENYDMEALLNAGLHEVITAENTNVTIFPNPSANDFAIRFSSQTGNMYSICIYDTQGKLIRKLSGGKIANNSTITEVWDGKNDSGEVTKKGIYYVSINNNGSFSNQRVIKL